MWETVTADKICQLFEIFNDNIDPNDKDDKEEMLSQRMLQQVDFLNTREPHQPIPRLIVIYIMPI